MKQFRLTADIKFYADDIDEAFAMLSTHFQHLFAGDENETWFVGEIKIEPEGGDIMPLTKKGQKIMKNMKKEYGPKKGESVFYASANAKKIKGVHKGKK